MNKYGKEKNNCHYRDCEALTDNLSRIKNKKRNVTARSAQVRTSKRNVMPILPAGKIQGIFELNKISGRSLEKIFKKIFRDDSYFLFAEILGSKLSFCPRMTEKWRCLRMTFSSLTLAAVLSFGIISESCAEEILPPTGSCGDGCLYEITTDSSTGKQNLRVYNDPNYTGEIKNIAENAFSANYNNGKTNSAIGDVHYSNANFNTITIDGDFEYILGNAFYGGRSQNIIFTGDIKNIGYGAFEYNNFISISLPKNLEKIEGEAFYGNTLTSLIIPDSVTYIDNYAFNQSGQTLSSVYIFDTLDQLGGRSVYYPFGDISNISVICQGDLEKCQSLFNEYNIGDGKGPRDLSDSVHPANQFQCTGEKYFWNGTSCSRKEVYCNNNMYYTGTECIMRPEDPQDIACDYESSGYIKVGDSCYSPFVTYAKKHYTPTEANQWLKDDDNEITITFKK